MSRPAHFAESLRSGQRTETCVGASQRRRRSSVERGAARSTTSPGVQTFVQRLTNAPKDMEESIMALRAELLEKKRKSLARSGTERSTPETAASSDSSDDDGDEYDLADTAALKAHVKHWIRTTGQADHFSDERYQRRARKVFDETSAAGRVLTGAKLRTAVLSLIPKAHADRVREEKHEGFSPGDRGMGELVTAFLLLLHWGDDGAHHCGISRRMLGDFAQFCLAWRLFSYFTHGGDVMGNQPRGLVDVIWICGPYHARVDVLVADLILHASCELPVSTTSRPREDWEEQSMHHHFVLPGVFDACKKVKQFLLTHEAEDGEYGYTYDALMEPGNERNRTCILPAPGSSKDGPTLLRSCGLQGLELRMKLIYVAAPADEDGGTDPIPEVAGALTEHYDAHPEAWWAELAARDDPKCHWDLVVDGSMDDEDAWELVHDFVKAARKGEKLTRANKAKTDAPQDDDGPARDKLSIETLFRHLMWVGKAFKPIEVEHIVPMLRQAYVVHGLDDLVAAVGRGRLLEKPEMRELAQKHAAENGVFSEVQFEDFIVELAGLLGLSERVLVASLILSTQGRLILDDEMVKWWFDALPRKFYPGMEYSSSDFTRLSEACSWEAADFTEGDAVMLFRLACQNHRKALRPGHAATLKKISNKEMVGVRLKIVASEEFEYLLEKVAERLDKRRLTVLSEIYKAAKKHDGYFGQRFTIRGAEHQVPAIVNYGPQNSAERSVKKHKTQRGAPASPKDESKLHRASSPALSNASNCSNTSRRSRRSSIGGATIDLRPKQEAKPKMRSRSNSSPNIAADLQKAGRSLSDLPASLNRQLTPQRSGRGSKSPNPSPAATPTHGKKLQVHGGKKDARFSASPLQTPTQSPLSSPR